MEPWTRFHKVRLRPCTLILDQNVGDTLAYYGCKKVYSSCPFGFVSKAPSCFERDQCNKTLHVCNQASVFVPGKPFELSLMLSSEAPCQGQTHYLIRPVLKLRRKQSPLKRAPGVLFTTFHFLYNLQIGPID